KPKETVADPYFGCAGPQRTACHECGECMTGCRHGAKNTLLKNYLYLAEKGGAEVRPLTTVTDITHKPGGGWNVDTKATGGLLGKKKARRVTADKVVVFADAWATQKRLTRQRLHGNI